MKPTMIQILIPVLVLLAISACSGTGDDPTPTPTTFLSTTPTSTLPLPPTNTANQSPDIIIGVADRGMNCPLITEIVALILEQELEISVKRESYEMDDDLSSTHARSPTDQLFSGLASGTIDLTLCFFEQNDTQYLRIYVSEIRLIHDTVWHNEGIKMKTVIHNRSSSKIEQIPCLDEFFENINFGETVFEPNDDAQMWIESHKAEIQSWLSCDPSKP